MTDSDSSTPVEEPVVLKDKKKKKKKHKDNKKKSRRDAPSEADVDNEGSGDGNGHKNKKQSVVDNDEAESSADILGEAVDSPKSHKREKKSKKKKDKKRKRSMSSDADGSSQHDADDIIDAGDNDDATSEKKSKKKHKKKSSKKKSKRDKDNNNNNNKHETQKEIDEKVVSSSAIEYYPEDLKDLQLKKNVDDIAHDDAGGMMKSEAAKKLKKASSTKNKDATRKAKEESSPTTTNKKSQAKKEDTTNSNSNSNNITLLLFYQYIQPMWDEDQFQTALKFVTDQGNKHELTGRMRVAREGLNCTLTGSHDGIRGWCAALRTFDGGRSTINADTGEKMTEFATTEFKLTDDLPPKQRFPKLHAFEVVEIVNYGLAGHRAPDIVKHGGTHLEPTDYHLKMQEKDTVIIDVRNHYEANIGRFDPPKDGAQMIDPMMRKSTEFPVWLDKPETKEMLRGKQVLMYCTGGVRCERASALLKQKIDTEEDTKELGIKGVFQLQGGIDKYFKEFPAGGLWRGKNYTFDKRFAHAPPAVEAVERTKKVLGDENKAAVEEKIDGIPEGAADVVMGKCEACLKPWVSHEAIVCASNSSSLMQKLT